MAIIYNHATMGDTQKKPQYHNVDFYGIAENFIVGHRSSEHYRQNTIKNCILTHYLSDVWEESIGGRMSELFEQPYTLSGVGVCGKESANKL